MQIWWNIVLVIQLLAAMVMIGLVLRKRLTITGSTLRPRPVAFKAGIAQALKERVWPLLEAGKVKPVIHRVFDAAQAADAHALMESSQHVGKIVLQWN
jgi:NADPH2:quinone reductase